MKTDDFKPMLSATCEDMSTLSFPVVASPKLDGIRCVIRNGVPLSRNLKPIPNQHVNQVLRGLPDLDGELIVGSSSGPGVFARTSGGIMAVQGWPKFTYHVFDFVKQGPFMGRLADAADVCDGFKNMPVRLVEHVSCRTLETLQTFEKRCVNVGYEGIMVRDPRGMYKFGRSTAKEGGLLKIKRWLDDEARVIGFVEQMHNGNEAKKDELGRTKRSSSKEGKTGKGTLGALVCVLKSGVQFEIGTGFDDADRLAIWKARDVDLHTGRYRIAKFKYQELSADGVPRFPVFLGWRNQADMD